MATQRPVKGVVIDSEATKGTAAAAGPPRPMYRTLSRQSSFSAQKAENDKKKDRKCGNCKACFTAEFWLGADKTKNLPLYDAEISIFATIFAWKGTVLPMVLWKPLFWFQIIFHVIFYVLEEHVFSFSDEVNLEPLSWTTLTIPSSLVVFFIVFYSSQCYSRFFDMYKACVGVGGTTMCFVSLLKLHLPADDGIRWNCIRFLLAAQHYVYYTLRPGGKVTDEEWDIIFDRHLLTRAECIRVQAYQGFAPLLMITWSLQEVKSAMVAQGEVHLETSLIWHEFQEICFDFRGHLSLMLNLMKQPVPWPYFHLLNLMVLLVLSLVGYGLVGLGHIVLTSIVHAVICTIFIGLKNLAVAMADPFGDDAIDFRVEGFLGASYKNAIAHFLDEAEVNGSELPDGLRNPLVDGDMDYREHSEMAVDRDPASPFSMLGSSLKSSAEKAKDAADAAKEAMEEAASETTGLLESAKAEAASKM